MLPPCARTISFTMNRPIRGCQHLDRYYRADALEQLRNQLGRYRFTPIVDMKTHLGLAADDLHHDWRVAAVRARIAD